MLDDIKARLGSISPARMNEMPKSVQRLLEVDMPRLIEVAEAAIPCAEGALRLDCTYFSVPLSDVQMLRYALAVLKEP